MVKLGSQQKQQKTILPKCRQRDRFSVDMGLGFRGWSHPKSLKFRKSLKINHRGVPDPPKITKSYTQTLNNSRKYIPKPCIIPPTWIPLDSKLKMLELTKFQQRCAPEMKTSNLLDSEILNPRHSGG